MQSKRIVFQCSSAACGNRAVKRVWMTEACTLVSLLIVVWCLHAFGPRTTTTMAWGSLTANPWVSAVCWKGTLSQGPAVWSSAEYVCFSWMGTQGSHSPRLSACVCVVMCVYAHMLGGGRECYNNNTGLISDIKQSHISGRKQIELAVALHLHLLQVHTSQSTILQGSSSPTRTLNLQSKPLMGVWLSRAISSPPPSVFLPISPTAEHKWNPHVNGAGAASCWIKKWPHAWISICSPMQCFPS